MKKLKRHSILLFFIIGLSQNSWAQSCKKCFVIASYNIENLFDISDDPMIDDAEFLPTSKKEWNREKYEKKLKNMSEVISKIGGKNGPDIIGLVEVENAFVLEDLVKQPAIAKRNYQYQHFDSPDFRGIDVALLYDSKVFSIKSAEKLAVIDTTSAKWKTRDILYAKFKSGKNEYHVFVNHWPSRRSGELSEAKRFLAANVARNKVNEILALDPNAKIILMGDFNDTPQDESITKIMRAVGTVDAVKNTELFDPLTELSAKGEGTHHFDKEWNMLDHFMISKGLLNQYFSAQIFKEEFIFESNPKYKGQPLRTYVGNKYLGGYSDHLPIFMFLRKK